VHIVVFHEEVWSAGIAGCPDAAALLTKEAKTSHHGSFRRCHLSTFLHDPAQAQQLKNLSVSPPLYASQLHCVSYAPSRQWSDKRHEGLGTDVTRTSLATAKFEPQPR
jgi:hypothetical protein